MINLSGPNITFNPVNRWRAIFDYDAGTGFVEVQSAGGAQAKLYPFSLSDTAGRSSGIRVNASYATWGDRFITVSPVGGTATGVGLANALTNARAAYDGQSGNHNAKLHAVELQLITDQIVDSLMAGS